MVELKCIKNDTLVSTQNDSVMVKLDNNNSNLVKLPTNTLESVIDEFLMEMKVRSLDTYRNYLCDLNQIAKYFFGYDNYKYLNKNNLESLDVDVMLKFRNTLYEELDKYGERKYSNSTINRRISSFKSLIKYLKARKCIEYPVNDLTTILRSLPNHSVETDPLSFEDAEKCLEEIKKHKNGYPIYLAAKLSIDTGLRAKEILTLQWEQFYLEDDFVTIKSKGNIKGKGNKDWEKQISHGIYEELLTLRTKNKKKLFNFDYTTLANHTKRAIDDLDLNKDGKKYSFHSFRKCAATNFHNLTKDMLAVQKYLNHSSLETTQRYVKSRDYGTVGIYSSEETIDKGLYKKVDISLLIEIIESDKSLEHLFNMKLNERIKNI